MRDRTRKSLEAVELEKMRAPFGTIVDVPIEDTDPGGGGGGATIVPEPVAADQPGNSDGHRDKPWHKLV